MGTSPIGGAGGVNGIDLSNMDLETALLAVQSQRANLLEDQLKTQMEGVQARNNQVAKLNDALGKLTGMLQYYGTNATDKFDSGKAWGGDTKRDYNGFVAQVQRPLEQAIKDAGITDLGFTGTRGSNVWGGEASVTRGSVDAAITKIKGMIDAQNSSQQMDMLRLQSLTNKRNEAFDIMTNFIKKMSDSRSSIIGNMR